MNLQDALQVITQLGVSGVLLLWLYSERKERLRLQRVVESFLPILAGTQRAIRSVSNVITAEDGENG